MRRVRGFILCFVVAASSLGLWLTISRNLASRSARPPAKVYILAGQSNMVGVAPSSGMPSHLAQPRDDVLWFVSAIDDIFNVRRWPPLEPGGVFGPEVSFARRMADHHRQPVGIIKVAQGGTSLAKDWSPDRRGGWYDRLIETVREAAQTGRFEIEAVIWMQGEQDARDGLMADRYAQNLAHFIQSIRGDLDRPGLPFVYGRINPAPAYSPFVDRVRLAQQELDVPNALMVDCDGLGKLRDGVHYAAAGQVELGRRLAAAVIQLTTPAPSGGGGSK